MKTTDLTPEYIESLYLKHGLVPCSRTMRAPLLSETGPRIGCCALGAFAYEKNLLGTDGKNLRDVFLNTLEDSDACLWFAFGFDDGFEGFNGSGVLDPSPAYKSGRAVGVHIRKLRLEKKL